MGTKNSHKNLYKSIYYRYLIRGVVQGVGFRPYVYRKAAEHELSGYVKNTGDGVEVVVNDKNFIGKLKGLPPLAKIKDYEVQEIKIKEKKEKEKKGKAEKAKEKKPQRHNPAFKVLKSPSASKKLGEETEGTTLPADIFMCKDCLKELRDKKNRRHDYYFITCTNCGPRFSMIKDYPYDRPFTSMNEFRMCNKCRKEYTNPLDRRYHAETIACKECGPRLGLIRNTKPVKTKSDNETIRLGVEILKSGDTLAIKGVGGFHLCSTTKKRAVQKLRELLKRPGKPFALMVKDIPMAEKYVHISKKEKELLESPERPIVVLKKKNKAKKTNLGYISELDSLGIMLPYTALHYLIFDYFNEPIVMTSCNYPGEPISTGETIGENFLTHERKIVNRCDDSVLKVINSHAFYLRRSRGYTPLPVELPVNCKDTIAVGAELNNVIAIAKAVPDKKANKPSRQSSCYLSQYIGDTSKLDTYDYLKTTESKMIKLTRAKPAIIVADLHPGYNSTTYAKELAKEHSNSPKNSSKSISLIQIQHHKAHVAGAAAEHRLKNYVGIAMDGLGYGDDGKVWGGEVFKVTDYTQFERIGHLEEQPQLGGDSATTYPKKMLFGILSRFMSENELIKLNLFKKKETILYLKAIKSNYNTIYTTSTGRILDAASAFLGLCEERTYDGRPAMLLESEANKCNAKDIPMIKPKITKNNNISILSTTNLFKFLLKNKNKYKKSQLAAAVHMYVAKGLYEIAEQAAKTGRKELGQIESLPIVFSGGVCYNEIISSFLIKKGALPNKDIPAGDGGICYGQAYLANLLSGTVKKQQKKTKKTKKNR